MLIDDIHKAIEDKAKKSGKVEEIVVGLSYTGVKLENGCGVAYTLREGTCCFVENAGSLAEKSVAELAKLAMAPEPVKASIGVATINALIEVEDYETGNPLDYIEITKNDVVGMVGFFAPLIKEIREKAKQLYIFERKEIEGAYPDWAIYKLLPECDIVIVTGVAVINKTIDMILNLAKSAKEVCVLGASTPLLFEVFKKYGVTMLGGIKIVNPKQVMRIIKEGGGIRNFGSAVEKIIIR